MASTYSSLKFELIATGEQSGTWGVTTDNNIGTAIEQAIVGMATLTAADFTANVATLTLTNTNAAQNARALCLNIAAGAVSAAGTINVPAIQKPYIIINGSSYTVTVKVSGLTGVAVPTGKRTVVYNTGTDVEDQISFLSSLTLLTALPAASGGTGQSSYAVGDLLYASTTTALSKLADVATGNALISGGVGVAPSYGKIGLTTHVSGTLPTTNGGTGLTSFTSGGVVYASSTSALATGSALTFDGTNFATTGTATATKLIPTGTSVTGNGMYLPATNSIGISTAGVNAVYIDASQNVGIGTSSPTYKLEVKIAQLGGTAGNSVLATRMNGDANGNADYLDTVHIRTTTGAGWTNAEWRIRRNVDNSAAQGAIGFGGDNTVLMYTNGSERMRIDSSGNVGIGTSSPAYKLQVNSGVAVIANFIGNNANNYIQLSDNNGANVASLGSISGGNWYLYTSGYGAFYTGGAEKMRIDSSGNVGIGTSSPAYKLQVNVAATQGIVLKAGNVNFTEIGVFSGNSDEVKAQMGAIAGGVDKVFFGSRTNHPLVFNTADTERMRIDTSGNVGIGTSSPASKFNVSGSFNAGTTASYPAILSGGAYGGGLGMQDGTGVSGIYVQSTGTQMVFFTGQTSADTAASKAFMFLDTGLGIGGGANASALLDVQSTTRGVRMPNMTTTQKNAIASPAAGLMVFDTTLAKLSVYSGTAWQTITSV